MEPAAKEPTARRDRSKAAERGKGTGTEDGRADSRDTAEEPAQRGKNWVTDLYDRANLSVRQLNIAAIALLGLIFALFVIFGK